MGENWEKIQKLVGNTLTEYLKLQNVKIATGPNIPIQRAEQNGLFLYLQLALNYICDRGENLEWTKWIWQSFLPQNIYTFMWRGMNNGLPFDKNIMQLNISIAWKCERCKVASLL